jgi:monoamine oxidase
MTFRDTEVVVVGGGAAGIAAARRLHDAGVPCLIVEARERLGGRAFTQTAGGYPLDLGCGWLHSADRNPWVAVAQGQGRTIDKALPPWEREAMTQGFPAVEQEAFQAAFGAFHARLEQNADCDPDVAEAAFLEPGLRWNGLIDAINTFISGAETDRVSTRDFGLYADSGINWRVIDGYGAMMVAHTGDVPVAFNAPVRRIDHSGRRLRIETTAGDITADRVVVTLPSTVIAEMDDLFAPALHDKTDAAQGLPLGLADKLFLSLDGAEEFTPELSLFGRTDTAATAAYNFRPFGRPMIEVYTGGRLSAGLEAGGEGAFFDFARAELTALLGSGFAKRIAPIALHCWQTDPFARGSYSYARPGRAGDRAGLAAPVDRRIFFAGEACSVRDFSTAHGAYLTGVAAAESVLAARAVA